MKTFGVLSIKKFMPVMNPIGDVGVQAEELHAALKKPLPLSRFERIESRLKQGSFVRYAFMKKEKSGTNEKMFAHICVAAVVGLAFAADIQHETKNAVNEVTTTKDGDLFCPVPIVGTRCPDSSVFHYYKCCGDLNKDCCFNLQFNMPEDLEFVE
ncbi:hypothetical protein TELCIR_05924 [Teladorsagia circumcincta]|uniref:Uncharacterized protein n=1 Tax=Teladorsagia circumcincta TaxID=45464 RepID=A0A2G9UPT5_TELCI|nr:hypothetical protein TELCIR_05924 [Teladorsagia circumcincta]